MRHCGFTRGGDEEEEEQEGERGGEMREIRHRVQSCQIVLVFFRSWRARLDSLSLSFSTNVIANVGAVGRRESPGGVLSSNDRVIVDLSGARRRQFPPDFLDEEVTHTRELFRR